MSSNIVHLKSHTLSEEQNQELLQRCLVGRLGTVDKDGIPYITPLNYAYDLAGKRIYIHHASRGGKLLDNLKINPHVCFQVEQAGEIVNVGRSRQICDGDQVYQSVIGFGQLSIADGAEKTRGLKLLGQKYFGQYGFDPVNEFEPTKMQRLVVLVIDIEILTGKCREPAE